LDWHPADREDCVDEQRWAARMDKSTSACISTGASFAVAGHRRLTLSLNLANDLGFRAGQDAEWLHIGVFLCSHRGKAK
jgi:hypothetical protein